MCGSDFAWRKRSERPTLVDQVMKFVYKSFCLRDQMLTENIFKYVVLVRRRSYCALTSALLLMAGAYIFLVRHLKSELRVVTPESFCIDQDLARDVFDEAVTSSGESMLFMTRSRTKKLPSSSDEFYIFTHNPNVDNFVSKELIDNGYLHPYLLDAVKNASIEALAKGETVRVYDLGANIGFFSLFCASLSQSIEVIAVEPVTYHSSLLQSSLLVNPSLAPRVSLVKVALGETSKDKICMKKELKNAAATFVDSSATTSCQYTVRMLTLDAIVEEYGQADIIKIDVEGYEPRVFNGARALMRSDRRPHTIISEFVPFRVKMGGVADPLTALDMMFDYGYIFTDMHCFYRHRDPSQCSGYRVSSKLKVREYWAQRTAEMENYFTDILWTQARKEKLKS
jgi:FkbM family methyltransferase